ncbi:MAG: MBL fold metallo-hydrolase [Bryobacteraceae bacterium]
MKIADRIYLVGSGLAGCSLTHDSDCNVYAIDCGDGFAIVDSGCGIETERLIANLVKDGIPSDLVRWLLLTHGHLDHAGGARALHDALGLQVAASVETGRAVSTGDEEAISLGAAKRAGIYPGSILFRSCPVAKILRDGDELTFDRCAVQVLETPGHSRDMISFLFRHDGEYDLFCGDTIFHGGRILLQDVADCDIPAYTRTLRRLASLEIDGLYPGHLMWSEGRGQWHLQQTLKYLDKLLLPPNIL